MRVSSILPILLVLLSASGQTKQSYYHKEENDKNITLQYQWRDSFGTQRNIEFDLEKDKIAKQYRQNKIYRPEIAFRYVYIEMQKHARTINPRDARIKFRNFKNELQIEVKAENTELQNKYLNDLLVARENAFVDYLKQNYYDRYRSPYGQLGVKPDHTRFVAESVTSLLPAAQAIYEQLDEESTSRAYVNLLLSWVQSIPYNALQDRMTSNGAGYLAPTDVLTANIGDCDSKTVLTAALLRSLLPQLHMVMVYLPNHALLGANLPHFEGEAMISRDGIDSLLLEPTGPAIMKVGVLGEETERYIGNGMYVLEKVPQNLNEVNQELEAGF
ncbi:MAG: hypothetical protein GJ680_09290 [Alteromonadaceae bacterium]|nr:hypothetical protein [Alteromonadaceae bacterium]